MLSVAIHSVDQVFIQRLLVASRKIASISVQVFDSNGPMQRNGFDIVITDRLQCQSEASANVHLCSGLTPYLVDQALSVGFVDVWSNEFSIETDLWARCCLIVKAMELAEELAEEQESSANLIDAFQSGKIERIPSSSSPSGAIRLVDEKLFEENRRLLHQIEKKNALLEELAHFDALTGLPNRRMFSRHLKREVARSARHNLMMALFFIDVDNFKQVNDTLGHDQGDELLKQIADRLNSSVREEDIVCRIAGDEFAVLLTSVDDPDTAGEVAAKVIKSASESYHLNDTVVHTSVSIGIACYPFAGTDADTLNKYADIAMYRAKESGRNCFRFYTEQFDQGNLKELDVTALKLAKLRR